MVTEIKITTLSYPKEISRTTLFQIFLCYLKTIIGILQYIQPVLYLLGFIASNKYTIRLVLSSSDTSS